MALLLLVVGFFAFIGYAIDINTGVKKVQNGDPLTPDESWDMWTSAITIGFGILVAIWAATVA